MEGNLPSEIAQEPVEEARLSQGDEVTSPSMGPVRKGITFAEASQSTENGSQASTNTYKDILSQPAPSLSHRQRMLWLQKRRRPGLWAQCDDCDRWRFLPNVVDAHELPAKWRCRMNPDKTAADCSVPEAPLRLREEEDLIHGEYSAGSVVWARLAGWPWWPAMVDDCPDAEQYYWLDGFSDIPTHYNVVFFDAFDVTRAWISPENLKPYVKTVKMTNNKKYRKRLQIAVTQADDASKLSLGKRLAKYSFITRYAGSINQPRKISKRELEKFQKNLKRKYDIDFLDESSDEEDDPIERDVTTTVINKGENVLLVGTPKSKERKRRRTGDRNNKEVTEENNKLDLLRDARSQETFVDDTNTVMHKARSQETFVADANTAMQNATVEILNNDSQVFKQPDSLVAQLGSNVTSTTLADITFDNDPSATYVPGSESENETIGSTVLAKVQERAVSPSSDDFDF